MVARFMSARLELPPIPTGPEQWMCPLARILYRLSRRLWGSDKALTIVGRSAAIGEVLEKVAKVAPFQEPVLLAGESGVGKELLAQAVYLLSPRRGEAFIPVNCPQFQDGNLTVSELFGHKKGSFTGAVADRRGAFEVADGGVIFLDEVGDLHPAAQVMLLRALATGEFQPLGDSRMRRVNVRVIAATNRPWERLRLGSGFREDLYFRLRYFCIAIPPLRERGDDWRLLVESVLFRLSERHGVVKHLSEAAWEQLSHHPWPGNVRELASVVTTGYAMAEGTTIEPRHFAELLEGEPLPGRRAEDEVFRDLLGGGNFWEKVAQPFLERELNRRQVQLIVRWSLARVGGSYKKLLSFFGLPETDYQRFMDFLRHHRLKPR